MTTETKFPLNKEHQIIESQSVDAMLPSDLAALSFLERPPQGPTVRLVAVGDIGLSGRVGQTGAASGYHALFEDIAPFIKTADIRFANLETPLLQELPAGAMFGGRVEAGFALKESGFSLLHLANNHITDFGPEGLRSTLETLEGHELDVLGAGPDMGQARGLVRTDVNGKRIGWLGCGYTAKDQGEAHPCYWEYNEAQLLEAVSAARAAVDLLIVSVHIGFMYLDYPHPDHKVMADRVREAGAHLVLMHHAHVLQGIDTNREGRVACFNLGNLLLDWEEGNVKAEVMVNRQQEGAVFVFDLDEMGVCSGVALPTLIQPDCRVKWARGERGREVLDRLSRISGDLEGEFAALFHAQRAERNAGHGLKVVLFHLKRGNWKYVVESLMSIRPRHIGMLIRRAGQVASRPFRS